MPEVERVVIKCPYCGAKAKAKGDVEKGKSMIKAHIQSKHPDKAT